MSSSPRGSPSRKGSPSEGRAGPPPPPPCATGSPWPASLSAYHPCRAGPARDRSTSEMAPWPASKPGKEGR
eukprot:8773144-Pyramimonas_sp.AAC.1